MIVLSHGRMALPANLNCKGLDHLSNLILLILRGSYTSAHVLLNLLKEMGKRDKMQGLPSILSVLQ